MAVLTKEALIREHTFLEGQVCLRCRQGIEDDDTRLQYAERTAYTDKLSNESKHPLENSSTVNQPKGSRKRCSKAVLPKKCYFCHFFECTSLQEF
jgi:hypothetical protein